jgi:hypothetical protein
MNRRHLAEDCVQRAVCQHLRIRGARGLLWWHTPNGGKRRPIGAAIMKSLGVRAGVSDLILLHAGRIFALELKAHGGRPTAEQIQFISDFNVAVAPNGGACIAHGIDRALRVLETWGLLRGEIANIGAHR